MRDAIDQGDLLTTFPAGVRSFIANLFCYGVRAGCRDVDSVIRWLDADIGRRFTRQYTTAEQMPHLRRLRELLVSGEARQFARFIIHREALPAKEREAMKAEKGKQYQQQAMAGQLPTDKQLAYLRSLRCPAVPKTKLEASRLIEKYKR